MFYINLNNQPQAGQPEKKTNIVLKAKYFVMGTLRNGNGKWGHAIRTIWFKSSRPYFTIMSLIAFLAFPF